MPTTAFRLEFCLVETVIAVRQCYFGTINLIFIYQVNKYLFQGCETSLNNWIYDNAGIIIGVAFGFGLIQVGKKKDLELPEFSEVIVFFLLRFKFFS